MPRPSLTAATTAPSKHSQRLDRLLQHMQPSHSAPPLQPAATAQPAMSTRNHNHQAQTSINSLPLHPPAHSGHRPATTSTIDDPYPPASNPSALLSPLQASFNLAHSSSYSASLTSHHTAATPSHASTLSTTDPFQPRRLQRSDYHAGFLSLLSQLTDVGEVSEPLFNGRFDELSRVSDTQQVWVIEDAAKGRVIATATLLIELKFIHGVSKIGHIEDVVVSGEYRGKNLGYKLIDHLLAVSRAVGCYKVILDCNDQNVAFYEKLGFKKHVNHMRFNCSSMS